MNIRELRAKFTASTSGFTTQLKDVKEDVGQIGDTGKDSGDKMNKSFSNVRDTLLKFAGAYVGIQTLKTVVGGVIGVTNEYQEALNTLQTKTGSTDEEMGKMSESLKKIYANNYGENFQDIAESMSLIGTATGLSGDELELMTERALMLRDTLGYDVSESTKTADTMMKQFGITGDEAMTLIAQGSQGGLDKSGDMLDSFNEYSVHFEQLGFDAEGMWNVFKSGADSGSFNMDKVGDSVKEMGIRVKEGGDATTEAFESVGLNAEEMTRKFSEGGDSSQEALQKTFKALSDIEDPVERNKVGIALMGTQFEDLGADTVLALGTVREQADQTGDTLQKMDSVKYDSFASAFEGMKRIIITDLLTPIEDDVMPLMSRLVEFMKTNMPSIRSAMSGAFTGIMDTVKSLAPIFGNLFTVIKNIAPLIAGPLYIGFMALKTIIMPLIGYLAKITAKFSEWKGFKPLVIGLATAFGVFTAIQKASIVTTRIITAVTKAWAVAQRLLNLAMKMNPIGLIIALIIGLVAGLIYAYQNSEKFREIVQKAWTMIKETVATVIAWFIKTIPQWVNNIVQWLKNMGNWISQTFTKMKNSVLSLISSMVQGVVNFFTKLRDGAVRIITSLRDRFVNHITRMRDLGLSIVSGLRDGVVNLFTRLRDGAVNIVTRMRDGVVNIVKSIRDRIVSTFTSAKDKAVEQFNRLRNGISDKINAIRDKVTGMKDKILEIVGGINLFSIGKNIVNGLIRGITGMASTLKRKVASFITDNVPGPIKKILGINSPSKLTTEYGENTGEGLGNGIENMESYVKKATLGLTNASVGTLNENTLDPGNDKPTSGSGGGSNDTNYNSPLMHVENQYVDGEDDVRGISNGLYGLQRNSDRKKGR